MQWRHTSSNLCRTAGRLPGETETLPHPTWSEPDCLWVSSQKKLFYMSQYKTRNCSLLLKCVHVYLLFGSVAPPCCTTLSGLRVMMVLTVLSKLSWDWMSTEYPASPMFWVVTLQPNSKVEPPTDASRMRLAITFTIGPGNRSGRSII